MNAVYRILISIILTFGTTVPSASSSKEDCIVFLGGRHHSDSMMIRLKGTRIKESNKTTISVLMSDQKMNDEDKKAVNKRFRYTTAAAYNRTAGYSYLATNPDLSKQNFDETATLHYDVVRIHPENIEEYKDYETWTFTSCKERQFDPDLTMCVLHIITGGDDADDDDWTIRATLNGQKLEIRNEFRNGFYNVEELSTIKELLEKKEKTLSISNGYRYFDPKDATEPRKIEITDPDIMNPSAVEGDDGAEYISCNFKYIL